MARRVCRHCKLEELFWQWEVGRRALAVLLRLAWQRSHRAPRRLLTAPHHARAVPSLPAFLLFPQGRAFALYSKAREGAGNVTAGDAIRQAQQQQLNRVGVGGLGEAAAGAGVGGGADEEEAGHLLLGAGRRGDAVAATSERRQRVVGGAWLAAGPAIPHAHGGVPAAPSADIVRRPGDAENTLRMLLHQLRLLKVPAEVAGGWIQPAQVAVCVCVCVRHGVLLAIAMRWRRLLVLRRRSTLPPPPNRTTTAHP